ncbi:MAG: carbohydrate ABC transporter permease [Thermodesulfobacteriota bacterium]
MTGQAKGIAGRIVFLLVCATAIVFFLFPFFWVLLMSLKGPEAAQAMPPKFVFVPTLENFRRVFLEGDFLRATWNSVLVALFSLGATLLIGLPAAYVIARHRQKWLSFGILFTQMTPWVVFLLPWYILFKQLGLIDTHLALVLSNLTYLVPFTVWLMLGFFEDIPTEVEEAAWLDGCSRMGTFLRIVLPLVKGGVITVCTLGFMFAWNIFIFPLILSGGKTRTLPVTVYGFMADNSLDFGPLAAASVLITLPVIVFVLLNQKHFSRGIALGGRK